MDINEIFEKLDNLVDAIRQKHKDIAKALEEDKEKCDNGELSSIEQAEKHASRYSDLRRLNQEFENQFQEAVDELLSKDAESNPMLASRIEKLKKQEASMSDIFTYGTDRVKQLKELFEATHNV